MRKKRESGRAREREGTRERGIITTITLPPWDRFREEEKGEEEDGEEDEEEDEEDEVEEEEEGAEEDGRNGLVVADEGEAGGSGKPSCAHRGHLVLYLWPSAMISSLLFRRLRKRVLRASNDIDRPETEGETRRGAKADAETTARALPLFLSLSVSRGRLITFYRIFIFLYYFFFLLLPGPTIRQIARNNGAPAGDSFRMLRALALAAHTSRRRLPRV